MTVFVVLICVVSLLPIAYFAVSKKSGSLLRRTAIAALILIVLSGAVSSILIISGFSVFPGESRNIIADTPAKAAGGFGNLLVIMSVFLIFLGVITFFALRELRRDGKK
jgi:hypothetical protein